LAGTAHLGEPTPKIVQQLPTAELIFVDLCLAATPTMEIRIRLLA
jgi:hypothetical protein